MEIRSRASLYPILGIPLAMGAPGGLLVLRVVTSKLPVFEAARAALVTELGTFAYVTASTTIVFLVLGHILGRTADRLERSASTDPLTGLHNRRHFRARVTAELDRAVRYHTPLAFLLIDVDELKRINDTGGHEAGDAAIRAVATAVASTCRATDFPARFGGDEFAVLAPGVSAEGALELALRIRTVLREQPKSSPFLPPTVSIGVTDVLLAGATAERMYSAADAALYDAKARGRDRAEVSPRAAVNAP